MAAGFRRGLSLVVGAFLCASVLLAQSKKPEDIAAGKVLVVPRDSPDPTFAEAVVLLVHYGNDGVLGLMINRRTNLPISRVLPQLKDSAKYTDPVFMGGPVELDVILALLQSRAKPQEATPVFGDVYMVSTRRVVEAALTAGAGPNTLRIYLGYCGWAPGQLENEVAHGGWYIFDGSKELLFDSNPATLWSRMIARAEQRIADLQGATPAPLWNSLVARSRP
jgi:putative AlgH/UPF0301 family transcriptional regulator